MPIINSGPVEERGKRDARRHRDKQKESIKGKLPEIISEENIITGRRDKIIKVKIRGIDIPHFKRKESGKGGGIGQGDKKEGDIIGKRPGKASTPGAGSEEGSDSIETEVTMEEVIQLMLEDLGLPNLKPKNVKEFLVSLGVDIKGIAKTGPKPLIHNRATAREGLKRFWHFLRYLQKETDLDEITCFDSLKKSDGIISDALKLLEDSNFRATSEKVEPFPIIYPDDQRYHELEDEQVPESRAVVIAMIDVSGSMDEEKKYLSRSMLFWLVEFLRQMYKKVEIRFAIHHSTAKLVDEHTFFHTMESGGTNSASAYELTSELIKTEYPTSDWNVYCFHFSDGDDWNSKGAVGALKKLFDQGISMFGYGEVDASPPAANGLFQVYHDSLDAALRAGEDTLIAVGKESVPYVGMWIPGRKSILPAIKEFLKKTRWQDE